MTPIEFITRVRDAYQENPKLMHEGISVVCEDEDDVHLIASETQALLDAQANLLFGRSLVAVNDILGLDAIMQVLNATIQEAAAE